MVSALTFSARGDGFDPRSRRGKISVSVLPFLSVICRDDTRYVRRPLDRDVNWRPPVQRESPLYRLKNHTVVYMITCRLSSCKTDVYNVRLLIILKRGCSSMYRKTEKLNKSFAK